VRSHHLAEIVQYLERIFDQAVGTARDANNQTQLIEVDLRHTFNRRGKRYDAVPAGGEAERIESHPGAALGLVETIVDPDIF
jgi:hypothetical protein